MKNKCQYPTNFINNKITKIKLKYNLIISTYYICICIFVYNDEHSM